MYPRGVQESDYVVFAQPTQAGANGRVTRRSAKRYRNGYHRNAMAKNNCTNTLDETAKKATKISELLMEKHQEKAALCVICFGKINDDKKVVMTRNAAQCKYIAMENNNQILSCSHKFHSKCIQQWFECKNFCPVCRTIAS